MEVHVLTRLSALLVGLLIAVSCTRAGDVVPIDSDDIGGVVTGAAGPEAGAWVIAETNDLMTKFSRIVVTDEQGRYLLPDLPPAMYQVWVRGYGLVDSSRVEASPGQQLNLTAVTAPDSRAAADYYPPKYWLALLDGAELDVAHVKDGCLSCHLIGNKATREISADLGTFDSNVEAWAHRLRVGPFAGTMSSFLGRLGPAPQPLVAFANWTDSIAEGAHPMQVPGAP